MLTFQKTQFLHVAKFFFPNLHQIYTKKKKKFFFTEMFGNFSWLSFRKYSEFFLDPDDSVKHYLYFFSYVFPFLDTAV